jgi:hypothetical protein
MNRDELIQAAAKDIVNGDSPRHGSNPQTHYLAAIAKLLLAQATPLASPRPDSRPWVDWGEDENP